MLLELVWLLSFLASLRLLVFLVSVHLFLLLVLARFLPFLASACSFLLLGFTHLLLNEFVAVVGFSVVVIFGFFLAWLLLL